MNAYYNQKSEVRSNNDIFEAYFMEGVRPVSSLRRALDSLLSFFLSLVLALTSAKVRRIARTTAVALVFVGFIGVIGAMESGTVGLGTGLILGALLLLAELLLLRQKAHK